MEVMEACRHGSNGGMEVWKQWRHVGMEAAETIDKNNGQSQWAQLMTIIEAIATDGSDRQ